MDLDDLDYEFPPALVAAYPPEERGTSRLLQLDRQTGDVSHHLFSDFPGFFQKGDLLIINDSKVFPARLLTNKKTGGKIEVLLVREVAPFLWDCLVTGKISAETRLDFSEKLSGMVLGKPGEAAE